MRSRPRPQLARNAMHDGSRPPSPAKRRGRDRQRFWAREPTQVRDRPSGRCPRFPATQRGKPKSRAHVPLRPATLGPSSRRHLGWPVLTWLRIGARLRRDCGPLPATTASARAIASNTRVRSAGNCHCTCCERTSLERTDGDYPIPDARIGSVSKSAAPSSGSCLLRAIDRLELLERDARPDGHAAERILGQPARHLALLPQPLIEALEE
jgi:hypothetical protein